MIILSKPSVSPYLSRSFFELGVPIILSDDVTVPMKPALRILSKEVLKSDPKLAYRSLLLTSSENGLTYLYDTIPHDDRILKTKIFKDKAAFRRALTKQFPNFFFKEVELDQLKNINPDTLPFPLIVKPSIGISSIGVIRVTDKSKWKDAIQFLEADLKKYSANYSSSVVESHSVLIEQWLDGRELAIDGYFDSSSEPVILNILEHLFDSTEDMSDRLYYTRRAVMRQFYRPIMQFLKKFGDAFDLKRFPFHLEVRVTSSGDIVPIELNPLRFSGLGTTEIAEFAYGINVYKYFFEERKPNWDEILRGTDDSIYSFMCVDIPSELYRNPKLVIDDRGLFQSFSEVLEYRILSEQETSTFAVIFTRSDTLEEAQKVLKLDLNQYFSLKK